MLYWYEVMLCGWSLRREARRLWKLHRYVWRLEIGRKGTHRWHQRGLQGRHTWHLNGLTRTWLGWHSSSPVYCLCLPDPCRLILNFFMLTRRCLSCKRHYVLPTDDHQPEGSLDLFLYSRLFALGDTILICVGQDNIHMLVIGHESPHHHPTVKNGDSHSKVDPLQELAFLGHGL